MLSEISSNTEVLVRLSSFVGLFALFAVWELVVPRRTRQHSKSVRWLNNLAIMVLNGLIVRLAIPLAAVGTAVAAQNQNLGLLNIVEMPAVMAIVVAILALDFILYLQHLVFHHVDFLWRLHRMHHADLDVDVTTGLRFHPIEIVLSMAIKMAAVLVLGAPVQAVIAFEVLLNASSLFNHANIYIPEKVDRILRYFIVTPDMHRVHHSVVRQETNSNFGFNVPWWDYLFRTYRAAPQAGQIGMNVGIEYFRTTRDLWLDHLLIQPFRKRTG
ncbi:MAG: sterol desaturase family protein [Gammaproteobacteria bacterium]|nr:sterol desaturase family protein [Gammaproteobacteria bacterium]